MVYKLSVGQDRSMVKSGTRFWQILYGQQVFDKRVKKYGLVNPYRTSGLRSVLVDDEFHGKPVCGKAALTV